jgi:hypothetical protein
MTPMSDEHRQAASDEVTQQIELTLSSGANLKLLYFSDRTLRWIFSYRYVGAKKPGETTVVVNQVQLTADYTAGLLAPAFVLSMHVIIPGRLGQSYFGGVDISPGAKTYLEFSYKCRDGGQEYRLVEICKGARERLFFEDHPAALIRPIAFPFPIPDRFSPEGSRFHVPFRLNSGEIAHFELPLSTLR